MIEMKHVYIGIPLVATTGTPIRIHMTDRINCKKGLHIRHMVDMKQG